MFEVLRRLLKYFRLLPCPACNSSDGNGRNELCINCLEQLEFIDSKTHCPGCGGIIDGALATCRKCLKEPRRPFQDSAAIFNYTGYGKNLLWRFKKSGDVAIGRALGELASKNQLLQQWDFDLVIPLPLYWLDLVTRSFNQSQIIAIIISKRIQKPYSNRVLKRIRRNKKQKLLNSEARHRNVKNAFRADSNLVKGKSVLLVDDIFTTGATLSSAANALLISGATRVYVLTLARA